MDDFGWLSSSTENDDQEVVLVMEESQRTSAITSRVVCCFGYLKRYLKQHSKHLRVNPLFRWQLEVLVARVAPNWQRQHQPVN